MTNVVYKTDLQDFVLVKIALKSVIGYVLVVTLKTPTILLETFTTTAVLKKLNYKTRSRDRFN